MAEDQRGQDEAPRRSAKLLGGRISCVVGLLLGVAQIFAAIFGGGANISAGALGVGLGLLGYFLGSRRLATAVIVLCVAAILFGLAASQGLIPGLPPSDHAFPTDF